jgi:acetyl esterase/lipase
MRNPDMKRAYILLFFCLMGLVMQAKSHTIYRDIPYVSVTSATFNNERNVLDVYAPKVKNTSTEVVVFIHGGKWKMGSKDMFNYVGVNFAEKGKTTVLINYRLTPDVTYEDMAMDCAKAVKWVVSQIEYYGGDNTKIYLYGHSSGGHLAALISTNNRFFDSLGIANPIKGCILIDPFGMNMYNYLKKPNTEDAWMLETFTQDEEKWKDASPALFVTEKSPKYLIFLGEKTKNIIYHDVKNFGELLDKRGIPTELIIMNNKSHMEMIGQMLDYRNDIYEKCIAFMKSD